MTNWTLQNFKADVKLRAETEPIFKKARPVPYALKTKVEENLDKAEREGILKKVTKSKWASPTVAPKADGNIRVCGDYKVTVNQSVKEDPYQLPNPENLFATLAGGKVFSKLDLSNAYQQLELTESSKELNNKYAEGSVPVSKIALWRYHSPCNLPVCCGPNSEWPRTCLLLYRWHLD